MQTNSHLSVLVHDQAKKYGDREALIYREFGSKKWVSSSWRECSLTVSKVSAALLQLGVGVQENIGVFAQNCVQYIYTDFGAWGIRAVTIPFYATSSEQQIQFMINDARVRLLFVGEQEQYDKAHRVFALCPTLERIVIFDRSVRISTHDPYALYFDDFVRLGEDNPHAEELQGLYAAASYDDMANILYTSGTTGDSKGVILTHGQYHAALEANGRCVNVGEDDRVMNFLPYAHIFEKGWTLLSLSVGARLIVNTYPLEVQDSMRETHPTCMSAVPRFWEKVYAGVQEQIDRANPVKRKLFRNALAIGRRYNIDYLSRGLRPPLQLKLEYEMVNRTVFSLVRHELGLEHANIFPTAGAPLSDTINEFLHICGINIVYGYGLSETTATVSCFDRTGYEFGTVGSLMPDIQVKLGENNEILVKGKTVMKGYYRKPEETARVFTKDGWFRTGDAGKINDEGALALTERLKDLFKTSNGKYIAPQALETRLGEDKYIDQVAVIGDQRKYVTAIIIPAFEALKEYAAQKHIQYRNLEDLVKNQKIHALISERIDALQKNFARFEQIKRFTLLPRAFSMEKGELTNTLKIRRSVINLLYKEEIEAMYA